MKYFLFILPVLASCTSAPLASFEDVVKKRASYDFACPENYVSVLADGLTQYLASGCGKKGRYEVKCSLGPCIAKPMDS